MEKQKAEHDKLMQLAYQKKESVRNTVSNLRQQFKNLKLRNEELPSYLRLNSEVDVMCMCLFVLLNKDIFLFFLKFSCKFSIP